MPKVPKDTKLPPRVKIYATGSRSSKSPPPEAMTHKMLETLLNWHPETLIEKEGGGHGTRPPAFFDMHLDDSLILKNLVYLPSMEGSIKNKVDGYLRSAAGKRIKLPPNAGFFDRRRVRGAERDIQTDILAEADVQIRYLRTTSTFLCRVASTLALKLPDWQSRFFHWEATQSGNRSNAVGDGFLKIKADIDPETPNPTFKTLQDIQKWFPNTAIWEFKNLTAGAEHHLQDIVRLSLEKPPFPWIRCSGGRDCPKHFDKNTGRIAVTGAKMGFDALDPVICLSTNAVNPTTNAWTPGEADQRLREHAIHLLQQVWAEAVRQDVTFMILQCGNFEMVLHRCRATNTFFISKIIVVDRRGYGRTQVGLYLSIYEDALCRVSQLSESHLVKKVPQSWLRTYKTQPAKGTGVSPRKRESMPQLLALQKVVEKKARSYTLALFHRKQGGYLPRSLPDEFKRLPSEYMGHSSINLDEGSSTDSEDQDKSRERQILLIDLEASISPLVFDAKLHTPITKWSRDLVVKYAHNDSDYTRLLKEFAVYHRLAQEEGFKKSIPDVIGCFTFEESPELLHATLVMKKCGTLLARHGGGVSIKDRISCIRILRAMHDAGYIHGSLNERKILRDIDSSIKFVGFSNTVECHNSEAKEAEYQDLLSVLNRIAEGYVQDLKEQERKRLGADATVEVGDCSILFGPVMVRNGNTLDINMERLLGWISESSPSLPKSFVIRRVERDFLLISNLTKEEAKQFYYDWLSSYPLGFDVIPIHTFPDYTLLR